MKELSFYFNGINWIIEGDIYIPGTLQMINHPNDENLIRLHGLNNYFSPQNFEQFIDIRDVIKNSDGDKYANKTEFLDLTKYFFTKSETKIAGRIPGSLFGDDSRTTRRNPVASGMWSHGLPIYGIEYTIVGSGRWFVEPDVNDANYFDGVSVFETGTDSDGKIFITSQKNRYQPGQLSYFLFTAGFHGFDTSNGNYTMLFGAMSRGLASDGTYGDIKEGICLGFVRTNGDFKHVLRVYKNFTMVSEEILSTTIPTNAEYLKILRIEIGYLGVHPSLLYKVNYSNLTDELEHIKTYTQEYSNVSNPNMSLGVYIENEGNTTNIQIKNGSFQYGNYAERESPDPSSRKLPDSFSVASIPAATETVIACYTLPEKLTMIKELNGSGIVTGTFYNTISNRLNKIKAYAESLAGKSIEFNIYLIPSSEVVATFNYLKPNVNALQRAVPPNITSVNPAFLVDAYKIATLNNITVPTTEDVSKENNLLRQGLVGVITAYSPNAISNLNYTIFTEDLF